MTIIKFPPLKETPGLPPDVASLIDSIGAGYWIPPIPTAEQRKNAETVLEALDRFLRPAKKDWLATRISIL